MRVHASLEDNWTAAAAEIRGLMLGRQRLNVLEAGGGSRTNVDFMPEARFTTIDISPEQLERNSYAEQKILADVETYEDYPRDYDMIICNDLLEHLPRPEAALQRLVRHLAMNGLLIVGGPIPTSFKGIFTKLTPHAVHVAVYRYLFGQATAGQPGHPPFPAYLRWAISPDGLSRWARAAGLKVAYRGCSKPSWAIARLRNFHPAAAGLYTGGMNLLRLLSLQTWRADLTDMVMVFQRRP